LIFSDVPHRGSSFNLSGKTSPALAKTAVLAAKDQQAVVIHDAGAAGRAVGPPDKCYLRRSVIIRLHKVSSVHRR
jgi:hypothetical protein